MLKTRKLVLFFQDSLINRKYLFAFIILINVENDYAAYFL